MTLVTCKECGKELNLTKKNIIHKIRQHIRICKISEREIAMAIGNHLSRKVEELG